ncbi:MAG: YIP1 family protein [Gammaproteobacteria bacterium]|nr:YIP1 family protein [Gammaproteobacteria bacterium]MDH4313616.1 YIP1 family protein [Gammaproteobacteria bacterium]MDH5213333.1 YIP1 family protein [Gammaproteobacteria bacterium]MDH5502337.1 YIP1 family protein [Gammaproteobacteria bacterium]
MIDLNRTFELVKGALFDSEATWRAYLPQAGDWKKTAFLLTGPLIVASVVLAYLTGLTGSGMSLFGFRPTIVSSLLSLVTGAITAGVVAFVFSYFGGIFGGKSAFALGLAATTLAFVPGYLGQALSGLPWIGSLLAIGLGIYGLVLLWRILPIYLEVPDAKRTAHYVVSLLVCIVVMFVIGSVLGRALYGSVGGPGIPALSGSGSSTGVLGGMARQAELIAAAQEDRYSPPADGEVSEKQVQTFIRNVERASELQAEKEQKFRELAEKADKNESMSFSDMSQIMSGVTDFAGVQTTEIEVVKSAGGNWAEHQWVRDSLRTAWMQKDISDAVAHNYALYRKYEEQLAAHVSR